MTDDKSLLDDVVLCPREPTPKECLLHEPCP